MDKVLRGGRVGTCVNKLLGGTHYGKHSFPLGIPGFYVCHEMGRRPDRRASHTKRDPGPALACPSLPWPALACPGLLWPVLA